MNFLEPLRKPGVYCVVADEITSFNSIYRPKGGHKHRLIVDENFLYYRLANLIALFPYLFRFLVLCISLRFTLKQRYECLTSQVLVNEVAHRLQLNEKLFVIQFVRVIFRESDYENVPSLRSRRLAGHCCAQHNNYIPVAEAESTACVVTSMTSSADVT